MKKIILIFIFFITTNVAMAIENIPQKFIFDAYHPQNYYTNEFSTSYADSAMFNLKNKNYKKAKKLIDKSLTSDLNNQLYLTYLAKGELNLIDNDLEKAEENFNKSIEYLKYNNPQQPPINSYRAYNNLAKIYLLNKDFQKALEYSDRAFNTPLLEKEFIETRIEILKEGTFEEKPFKFNFEYAKDEYFMDSANDWQKTLDELKKEDDIISKSRNLTFGEECGFTQKQIKSAEDKNENLYMAMMKKAGAVAIIGYKDLAWSYIEEVLENYNSFSFDNKILANLLAAEIKSKMFNEYDVAIKYLDKAIEIDNNSQYAHEAHYTRAYIYLYKLNKYEDAYPDIKFVMNDNPDEEDYKIAIYYHISKYNFGDAIFLCNKAIEIYPEKDLFKKLKIGIEKSKKIYEKALKDAEIQAEKERQTELKKQKWLEKRPNESWLYYFKRTGQNPYDYMMNGFYYGY